MQNPNPNIISDLARFYNLDYSSAQTFTGSARNGPPNFHTKICIICNHSFYWTGNESLIPVEKSREIYQNKLNLVRAFKVDIRECGRPESDTSEASFYAAANVPFCENCSKEVGVLQKLLFQLDEIVTQIDGIRNHLGNFVTASFPSTIPDQINYPVKKLIIQKLRDDFTSDNSDHRVPVVPPISIQGSQNRTSFVGSSSQSQVGHSAEVLFVHQNGRIERSETVEENSNTDANVTETLSSHVSHDFGLGAADNDSGDSDVDSDKGEIAIGIDTIENGPTVSSNPEANADMELGQDYLPSDEEIDEETKTRRKRWPRKNKTCTVCNKTLCTAAQLIVHMRTHTGDKPFKCTICEKGFISKFSLKCHTQTHSEQDFPCPHCPRIFKKYVSRHAHIKHKHKNIPYIGRKETAICEVCGDGFTGPISLQNHIDLVHVPLELFPCSICAKPCKKSALRKHERTHDPSARKERKCPDCPDSEKLYKSLPELRKHYAKKHPDLEPPAPAIRVPEELKNVKCNIETCTGAFKTRRGLRHHYEKKHPGVAFPLVDRRRTADEMIESGKEKLIFFGPKVKRRKPFKSTGTELTESHGNGGVQPYGKKRRNRSRKSTPEERKCHICGKEFKLRFGLLEHLRVHTGEKPFKCTYCDRYFACKGNQQKHELVHNENRFKELKQECKLCDAKYALRGSLYHHIRRHHDKIPLFKKLYKCPQCPPDKRGFQKFKLRIHISRVHSEETKKKLEERRHAKEMKEPTPKCPKTSEDEFEGEPEPSTSTIRPNSSIVVRRSNRNTVKLIQPQLKPTGKSRKDERLRRIRLPPTPTHVPVPVLDKILRICIPRCDEHTFKTDTGNSSTTPAPMRMKIIITEIRSLGRVEQCLVPIVRELVEDDVDIKIFDEPNEVTEETSIWGI